MTSVSEPNLSDPYPSDRRVCVCVRVRVRDGCTAVIQRTKAVTFINEFEIDELISEK